MRPDAAVVLTIRLAEADSRTPTLMLRYRAEPRLAWGGPA